MSYRAKTFFSGAAQEVTPDPAMLHAITLTNGTTAQVHDGGAGSALIWTVDAGEHAVGIDIEVGSMHVTVTGDGTASLSYAGMS